MTCLQIFCILGCTMKYALLFLFSRLTDFGKPLHQHTREEPGRIQEIKPSSARSPLWFDYPDSDKEKILAVYHLIGEEPVFIAPSTFPQQLRYILVGSVLLVLLFFLYQICTKASGKKGTA